MSSLTFNSVTDTSGTDFSQSSLTVFRVKLGDTITFNCSYSMDQKKKKFFWYKQEFGQTPQIIGLMKTHSTEVKYNEFNSTRFRIMKTNESVQLTILLTKSSDEAVYFCGVEKVYHIEFGNGTFLKFQGKYF